MQQVVATLAMSYLADESCLQCANVAVALHLIFAADNAQLQMAVHALADGPLAAALIVWQSAWVFGSAAHSIRYIRQLASLQIRQCG